MTGGRRGFTLLELVVAAALVAVAAVVVAGAFAAGLRVFERARQFGRRGDSVLAMEIMKKDLRNAAPSRLGGFRGGGAWVEIPLVVRWPEGPGGEAYPGFVRYEEGRTGLTLDRVTTVYVLPDKPEQVRETLMGALVSMRFSFADAGPDRQSSVSWLADWANPTNLPAAVKIVIESKQNGELLETSRTVVIPRG